MIFKEEISLIQAQEFFNSELKMLELIASVKWSNGYICRHCHHDNYCRGKSPFSRRCTRCKREESAAAHTLFHNLKFPVNKAFYIAYHVCALGEDFSSYQYAEKLNINQMTCWKFRKRILDCLNQQSDTKDKYLLKDVLLNYKDSNP